MWHKNNVEGHKIKIDWTKLKKLLGCSGSYKQNAYKCPEGRKDRCLLGVFQYEGLF